MADIVMKCETGNIKLSPVLFRLSARDYFKSYLDFEKPAKFSPVPFFLCCRAIELALRNYLKTPVGTDDDTTTGHMPVE